MILYNIEKIFNNEKIFFLKTNKEPISAAPARFLAETDGEKTERKQSEREKEQARPSKRKVATIDSESD